MNPQTNLHPLIASSIDPTKVSATVTGFLTSITGLVLLIANLYHFPLSAADYAGDIQLIGTAVFTIVSAVGAAYMLFGLARKIVMAFFPSKSTVTPLVTVNHTAIIPTVPPVS